jgi:hypothetical protein
MKPETYYAVRIGDPRRHQPYFMLVDGKQVPALFATREEAEMCKPKQPATKVVRVKIQAGQGGQKE